MKKNTVKEETMRLTFTHMEIDMISLAIKTQIETLKGWELIFKDAEKTEENKNKLIMTQAKIRMYEELQEKTSYIGQSYEYK